MRILLSLIAICCVCAAGAQEKWQAFRSIEGGFSVQAPGKMEVSRKFVDTAAGRVLLNMFSVSTERGAYLISYSDHEEAVRGEVDSGDVLEAARDGAVRNAKGNLTEDKKTTIQGNPARSIKFAAPGGVVGRGYIVLAKRKLYQVLVIGAKDFAESQDASRFLNSFKLG